MRSRIAKYFRKIGRDKRGLIIFIAIFALFIFLRFYQIEERNQFHIDQVNDAWVVKNFIVDGKVPLLGTPARLNSGIFMGPLYYYYLSAFYFFTNLDPVAGGVSSGVAGIITLLAIFFVARELFSTKFALIAMVISANFVENSSLATKKIASRVIIPATPEETPPATGSRLVKK